MHRLVRRLGFYALTAWVALTINFLLPRLVPGNPVADKINQVCGHAFCDQATIDSLHQQFGIGIDDNLLVQYVHYGGNLLHGDLGVSWMNGFYPVTSLLGQALPWTLALLGVATVIAFLLGTLLGVLLGWRRGSWLDWMLPAATFFQAVPYFFLALVLLMVFGSTLHWFPTAQGYDILGSTPGWNAAYIGGLVHHAVLPAGTIVLASVAGWMMGMRNMMVITMDEDFVLVARAKGLPSWRVVWYAARNALLPSVANFSLAISLVVAGQLLVEIIFSYPGVGKLLYDAVLENDYPLVQGIFLVITLVVLAANLIADVVYALIDPRTRQEA